MLFTSVYRSSFQLSKRIIFPNVSKNGALVIARRKKSVVANTEKGLTVHLDVKDMKKENISVGVEGDFLVIDVQLLKEIPGAKTFRQIYRQYKLSPNNDIEDIQMTYYNEHLKVHVPNTVPRVKWTDEAKNS